VNRNPDAFRNAALQPIGQLAGQSMNVLPGAMIMNQAAANQRAIGQTLLALDKQNEEVKLDLLGIIKKAPDHMPVNRM